MKLIIITRPDIFEGEALWITSLMQAGLQYLHLRKPTATQHEVERLLNAIPSAYHGRIILHDHFELTQKYHLLGVHLNGRNPHAPISFVGHISRSCHSLQEVAQHKGHCTYVTLSPIYNSISKQGYASAFTTEQLEEAAQCGLIDSKVIALGGITAKHIAPLHQIGFGGIALMGAIWNEPTIEAALQQFNAFVAAIDWL